MATETEIERMVIRLVGDGSLYRQMMSQAASTTASVATSIQRNTNMIQKFTGVIENYASGAIRSIKGIVNAAGALTTMGLGSVGAGGAAGLLGLGGIAGAVSGAGWGISLAREAEKAAISFEVMLGSASAGKKMLEEITDFAAKTPFEMPGLRSAAQMMLNFGVAQDKIMPTLKALGDVSAGDSNKLHGLAYAYSQTQAAGRLMGGDLMQMVNYGFNPLEEMARKSGKSLQYMRDQMAAGKISAKMVEEAFISASGPGGKFFNMMEKQSNTFDGLMSTMADTVKLEVTKIGTMLIEKLNLKGLLKSAIAAGERVGPAISGAIGKALDWIIPKVQWAASMVGQGIEMLYPIFSYLADFASNAFKQIGYTIQDVGRFIGPIGPYIDTVKSSITSIVTSVREWIIENQNFLKTLSLIPMAIGAFLVAKAAIVSGAGAIGAALALVLNPIGLTVTAVTTLIYLWTTYTESGKAAASAVGEAFGFAYDQFGMLVALVKAGEIELAWKVTTTTFNLAWAESVKYLQQTWIGVKTYFAQSANLITHVFLVMWEGIKIAGMVTANALIMAFNAIVPKKFEIPEFDVSGPMENILKLKEDYQAVNKELLAMQDQEMAAAAAPADEARKAWEEAQRAANKVVAEEEEKKKNPGGNWLGTAMTLGSMAVDQIKELTGPAMDAASTAGKSVGGAYTAGVKSQMTAIDAVKAGGTEAYNLLSSFRSKFEVANNLTQGTGTKPEEKPMWGSLVAGVNTLIEVTREKAASAIELVPTALKGA